MRTILKTILFTAVSNFSFCQTNWIIENQSRSSQKILTGDSKAGGKYILKNTTVDFSQGDYRNILSGILKYGKRGGVLGQTDAINLVWGSQYEKFSSSNFINIERKPGISGPLKTGEPVALRFQNGGYLSFGSTDVGVELQFKFGSSTIKSLVPYEFYFYGESGIEGEEVRTNVEYALKNSKKNDYLIYCRRDYGINLAWFDECSDSEMSILNEFKNKLPIVEKGIKEGKRLYRIVNN